MLFSCLVRWNSPYGCTILINYILDVVLPLNESPSHHLLIELEYFVDVEEKYFNVILLHINLVFYIGAMVGTVIGTFFIACYQHIIRSIFRIAR